MFVKAGSEILVFCDYKSKSLRVGTDAPLLPGYRGSFREIAKFTTVGEWARSEFSSKVTDEEMQIAIDWFWIDISSENIDTT